MQHFALKTYTDQSPLFEGHYTTLIDCLETAVSMKTDLSYIDLKHQNLSNANLDNAHMPHANFSGANLTGTNLSESTLNNAIYFDATLYNTCFAYSDLKGSDFRGASFGATMIEGCTIKSSKFSTLSCFDLDFPNAFDMHGCTFEALDGKLHNMSCHPIIVKGFLNKPIIIMDHTIALGTKFLPKKLLPTLLRATSIIDAQQSTAIKG